MVEDEDDADAMTVDEMIKWSEENEPKDSPETNQWRFEEIMGVKRETETVVLRNSEGPVSGHWLTLEALKLSQHGEEDAKSRAYAATATNLLLQEISNKLSQSLDLQRETVRRVRSARKAIENLRVEIKPVGTELVEVAYLAADRLVQIDNKLETLSKDIWSAASESTGEISAAIGSLDR